MSVPKEWSDSVIPKRSQGFALQQPSQIIEKVISTGSIIMFQQGNDFESGGCLLCVLSISFPNIDTEP